MEAAGLAIGVLGLVGAFNDAIDLFALFTAGRDFGRDFLILLTKLDIEKFLLLQWAEQVGLLQYEKDRFDDARLNDPDNQALVFQVLSCMRLLLENSANLTNLYGVKESAGVAADGLINIRDQVPTISEPCMERFESKFRALKISIKSWDRTTSSMSKARWVIHDRAKFGNLVSELGHFTTKLKDMIPPMANSGAITSELNKTGDLEHLHDISKLNMILEASAGQYGAIAGPVQERINTACRAKVLQTLWFRKINDRRESIDVAHHNTFDWAFEDQIADDNLANWLQYGSGIYWVSGKAGSGKSTFMKYLLNSPQMAVMLSGDASFPSYTIADFFFSYLGSPEQNTLDGLSKAIIYKIFSRFPELLCKALPDLWKEANEEKQGVSPPSPGELKYAVEVVSTCEDLPPFCLMIDGIDEYQGDIRKGISFINRLSMNPRIKIIVSSRPEPRFMAAFGSLPHMTLQELTRGDIANYVNEVIGGNEQIKPLFMRYPEQSQSIMNDIVDKASGVFLWVILACQSLIDGYIEGDRIDELRHRVEELPEELKDMFAHMLDRIDKRYGNQAARLLRLCFLNKKAQAEGHLETERLYALQLAFLAEYLDKGSSKMQYVAEQDRPAICRDLDRRLRSRCGGLLEITKAGTLSRQPNSFCFCEIAEWDGTAIHCDHRADHDEWADATVTFMHRTVYDFLDTEEAWNIGCLQSATVHLDVDELMSMGHLYLAVQSQRLRSPDSVLQILTLLRDGFRWGVRADVASPSKKCNIFWNVVDLLDRLCLAQGSEFDNWVSQFAWLADIHSHDRRGMFSHATLVLGIEAGAVNYVRSHPSLRMLARVETNENCTCLPLLQHAIAPKKLLGLNPSGTNIMTPSETWHRSNEMVALLLSVGCNPNEHIPLVGAYENNQSIPIWAQWLLNQKKALLSDGPLEPTHDEQVAILKALKGFILADAHLESSRLEMNTLWHSLAKNHKIKDMLQEVRTLYNTCLPAQSKKRGRVAEERDFYRNRKRLNKGASSDTMWYQRRDSDDEKDGTV